MRLATAVLKDVALINPSVSDARLNDDDAVSFVPMSSLSAETASIESESTRSYREVKKGYTPFLDGDVLFAKITPCFENGKIGQARITHAVGFGSTEFHVIRPRDSLLDGRYLHHFLRLDWVRKAGVKRMTGSAGQQRVPKAFLESLEIPVPPLDEQRRIVGILDKAEELRAKRRTAIALLDQLPQAIFLEMFGDPAHNPKGWPRFPFQELADRRLGKMLDKKKQSGEEPLPYLGNANVQWFRFELKNLQRMTFTERERSLLRLEPGDVLICEGGEPGRCAVWTGELQGCYFQKAIHRARVDRSKLEPEYVVHCLYALTQHDGLKDYVTVATIAHLTGEKLDILPFPVPPINLQRRFAARVEKIRHSKAIEESALAQSDALFASLQHRAFVGVL